MQHAMPMPCTCHAPTHTLPCQVRKLEFIMAEARQRGHDCVITIGGIQSNHARATVRCAGRVLRASRSSGGLGLSALSLCCCLQSCRGLPGGPPIRPPACRRWRLATSAWTATSSSATRASWPTRVRARGGTAAWRCAALQPLLACAPSRAPAAALEFSVHPCRRPWPGGQLAGGAADRGACVAGEGWRLHPVRSGRCQFHPLPR